MTKLLHTSIVKLVEQEAIILAVLAGCVLSLAAVALIDEQPQVTNEAPLMVENGHRLIALVMASRHLFLVKGRRPYQRDRLQSRPRPDREKDRACR